MHPVYEPILYEVSLHEKHHTNVYFPARSAEDLLYTLSRIWQNPDIFLPSSSELTFIYPKIDNPELAAKKLIDTYDIQTVAIKLGAQGCLIMNKKEKIYMSSFKGQVVDTTGAGDSFAAAFTVGIQKGWDLSTCAELANAAGAITITRIGARTALPTMQEINRFLKGERIFKFL